MLLGMLTTAATFYGLVFVDFPSLQQLGLVIGHSMVACGLLTLVLVPALLPKRRSARTDQGVDVALARVLDRKTPNAGARRLGRRDRRARRGLALASRGHVARAHAIDHAGRAGSRNPSARCSDCRAMSTCGSNRVRRSSRCSRRTRRLVARVRDEAPGLTIDAASALLPSDAAQERSMARVRARRRTPEAAQAALARAASDAGFRQGTLDPFFSVLPRLLDPEQRLTFDGYRATMAWAISSAGSSHAKPDGWTLATYAFPSNAAEARALERIAASSGHGAPDGLALVNRELAARFVPQFLRGLSIGSLVVVLMIALTFRTWRLSLLAIVPTVAGLIWAAGLLALARVPLDLFALFAVVTFVGIGIDYGIHVVHRYRDHGDAEARRGAAGSGDRRRRIDHAGGLRDARHLELSAACDPSAGLGGQCPHAGRRVRAALAGVADRRSRCGDDDARAGPYPRVQRGGARSRRS